MVIVLLFDEGSDDVDRILLVSNDPNEHEDMCVVYELINGKKFT